MNVFRQKKVETVVEIKNLLASSSSLAIAEYRGLSVAELQNLRQELKQAGVFSKVYKNRLFKIAASESGFNDLEIDLVGPNIFTFGSTDPIAPAKIIAKTAKEQPLIVLKGGIYDKKVVSATEMAVISTLPNYEESLALLGSALFDPLRKLAIGLKLLVDEGKISA
ncbi:50S ribosomal protein L10 [Mycoplasma sp. 'Moose RK']|uniref:50S ribosomal protein L10 n=1 Tax=Mycoplasma sp. 'Moose RK' TaxID=2780095 RepID=UPI0018C1D171|nr:50S ribosomal protein L10 [Mycoplasma sp. 'Moose RK']MBG0730959.1 50S ribosomal protein L10 [Mycoplasma sp. 'Moose RK']